MDVISLSAIKKAKKEIVDLLNKIDGQTLQSMVLELRNTLSKLDREKLSAADFNQMMASIQEYLASKLDASISSRLSKADFDSWKAPWTGTRAAKLDRLDTNVSSRADGSYYTPARGTKLDKLDTTVSSRLSKTDFDTGRAALKSDISRKIDTQGAALSTAVGGVKDDVLSAKKSRLISKDSKISTYKLLCYGNKSLSPTATPPGTVLYQIKGPGKLIYFLSNISSGSSAVTGGLLIGIELDGEPFATLRIEGTDRKSVNVIICSMEGVILNGRVEKFLNRASVVPLDLKSGKHLEISTRVDHRKSEIDMRETKTNLYFGGEDLAFRSSLKIKLLDYIGYTDVYYRFGYGDNISVGVLVN